MMCASLYYGTGNYAELRTMNENFWHFYYGIVQRNEILDLLFVLY